MFVRGVTGLRNSGEGAGDFGGGVGGRDSDGLGKRGFTCIWGGCVLQMGHEEGGGCECWGYVG